MWHRTRSRGAAERVEERACENWMTSRVESWTPRSESIATWARGCWNRCTRPCWHERSTRGDSKSSDKAIRFEYEGMVFAEGFRIDLLVDKRVIVELKSVERLAAVHSKQLLTYLKLTNTPVGLLINFGAATLREGLQRIVNGLPASASPRLRVNRGAGL